MSLIERTRIVAANIEAVAGTPTPLTSADASFYTTNSVIANALAFTARTAAGSLSQVSSQPGVESGTHNFDVDVYSGAPWAGIILPAAGMDNASGDWRFTDDPELWRTLTSGHNIGGKLKTVRGAMVSTLTFNFRAGEPTVANVALSGAYQAEVDAVPFVPSFPAGAERAAPKLASATFTIGGQSTCFATATLAITNTISQLLCATKDGGIERAFIESRVVTLVVDPLEVLAAVRNDHAFQAGRNEQAVELEYGSMSFTMPAAQITNIANGARNGLSARALTFQANRSAVAGDELSINFNF